MTPIERAALILAIALYAASFNIDLDVIVKGSDNVIETERD